MATYDNWKLRCEGKLHAFDPKVPEAGLYRMRVKGEWELVRISETSDTETGEVIVLASVKGREGDARLIWSRCAPYPVTKAMAMEFQESGQWPDSPPECQDIIMAERQNGFDGHHNPNALERASHAITQLALAASAWREEHQNIETQEDANRASGYAEQAQYWEKSAKTSLDSINGEAKRFIKDRENEWKPLIRQASDLKDTIKTSWIQPWLEKETEQREEEASSAADTKNMPRPGAGAGAGRRVSLRETKVYRILDARAFLRWACEQNWLPGALEEALPKAAKAYADQGILTIPGVTFDTQTKAV